jgi:ubiquinone/menaquinone biosynthesis C-methylase UbiE
MALFEEYTDPRLVVLYDTVCPWGEDRSFYLELAADLEASTVIDVGCGTGLLTCELAAHGHRTIGVDPSPAMLDVARARARGDQVEWIEGDARQLGGLVAEGRVADLVIMTGHVAQIILEDEDWRETLATIHGALRPGGRLAFESRDPKVSSWAAGKSYAGRRRFEHPVDGVFHLWQVVTAVFDDRVSSELHYELEDGSNLVSGNVLRFRTQAELTSSLTTAGFSVEEVFGDWAQRPVGPETDELIFVARRS